jgi:hypothetical protein
VWIVTRFKIGCERGRWLPDWFARSGVRTLEVQCVGMVCVIWFKVGYSGVREGCGWLASLKMKMVWERDVAGCGWRWWINLILLQLQICAWRWKCEMWIVRERLRIKEKDGWSPVDARVKNKHFVFCIYSTPPTEPVLFGWGFSSFRFLKPKPNRIEKFFKNFNRFFFTVRFF